MNTSRWMILVTVVALVGLMAVWTAHCQEDVTTVQDSAFTRYLRPVVAFVHDEHNETAAIEACNVCHHVVEDGQVLEDESSEDTECSECHAESTDPTPMALVRAYHNRCKGCHQQQKAGPVQCAKCHRK